MKKLLNNLYISQQGSYLSKERETIVIKDENKKKTAQFPMLNISGIFCFGRISVSPVLMGDCAERGIGLGFFTVYGRFLARVQGKISGNVLLRREQYRWADDEERCLAVARLMVAAKITNARSVLQRELRNHGSNVVLENVVERFSYNIKNVARVRTMEGLRGIEGEAARMYFAIFNELVRDEEFVFAGRVRRPPTDPVNAMLSFAYVLLTNECVSALAGVGLDPYVGFLHKDRPGRASLALDLLEEFRPSWADRLVLTLINRGQFGGKHFVTEASGAVKFTENGKKIFLEAYQERKRTEIEHPYLKEKIPLGLLPHCQALLLARHLRGDMAHYPPYFVK